MATVNLLEWLPFILTWGLSFDLYLLMQIVVLRRFRGGWLLAALPPLPVMIAVVVLTVHAYRADSNLWPIYLILVSIPAAGYLPDPVFRGTPHPEQSLNSVALMRVFIGSLRTCLKRRRFRSG